MNRAVPRTIVVIPTYNEVFNIGKLISQISDFYPEFDILIVDDASPDGTGRIVEDLLKKYNKTKILHRDRKSGLGKAYIDAFNFILLQEPPYERIIQMDADFSHNPKYLCALLEATQYYDISIGSRYVSGGKLFKWGLLRKVISFVGNCYARFWVGIKVKDITSGFRCFKRQVLMNIGLRTIKSNGYLFQIELLTRCIRSGYSVKEIPITFTERENGKSKFGICEIMEAVLGIPKLHSFSVK